MPTVNIMPTPSTSPYGVTTDKRVTHITYGDQTIATTRDMSRKRSSNTNVRLFVPFDQDTKRLVIFSDENIENPQYHKKEDLPSNQATSGIENNAKISEQTYFEIKHNRERGFYSTEPYNILNPKLDNNGNPIRTYLQTFTFDLNDAGVTILDLNRPDHELIYNIFKVSSKYPSSKFAMNMSDIYDKNMNARQYVVNEELEQGLEMQKRKQKINTVANLSKVIEEFSPTQLYRLCVVLKLTNVNTSTDALTLRLTDFVDAEKNQYNNHKDFNKYFKMCTDKKELEQFMLEYYIQEAKNKSVLRETPDGYIQDSQKATNLYNVAKNTDRLHKFFKDPTNREAYEMLKDELKLKGVE